METKICKDCNKELSIDDFHWAYKDRSILKSYCKACSTERVKRFIAKNPVECRIYSQQHYNENKQMYPGNYTTKSLPKVCGVYLVTCSLTNDTYIGSSSNIRNRYNRHKRNSGRSVQKDLSALIKKYTWDAFYFEVLETCDPSVQFEREAYYKKLLNPTLNRTK